MDLSSIKRKQNQMEALARIMFLYKDNLQA